jgi:hypothetical protein
MDQQKSEKLEHIVTVELEDFRDIYTVRSNGVTVKAWPLKTHLRMLKFFLLWFKWHIHSFYCTTSEDDVLLLKKSAFDEYIRSEEYAEDNAAATISHYCFIHSVLLLTDVMSTVLGYMFLPTELLRDADTRPSSTLLLYLWYYSTLLYDLVLAGTAGTLQYLHSNCTNAWRPSHGTFVPGFH